MHRNFGKLNYVIRLGSFSFLKLGVVSTPPPLLWLAHHNPHPLKTLIIPLEFQSLEFRGVDIEFDIKMQSTTISCMPVGAGFWGVT